MSAVNQFKGKFNEGTFANGEGPIKGIEIKTEAETKGVLGGTDMHKLKTVGGTGDGLDGRAEEKGFDVRGASYKGPQNFGPKDMGEVHNFDVNPGK